MGLIREISVQLGMSEDDIARLIASAPRRYKVFAIPKRSGSGYRLIAQPARELKAIQQYVMSEKLKHLKIHPIATAYRPGMNIRDNAEPHAKRRVIMKLDFRDFFHSIVPADLQILLKNVGLHTISQEDRKLLSSIFFWQNAFANRLCLSIGSPSSPFISNAVMEPLDREISKAARSCSVICTRYADDITLSANSIENLVRAEQLIKKIILRSKNPKLQFNDDKRGVFTSAVRRVVTGLVLTPDGKVSLGRDRKRKLSAALHHISVGREVSIETRHQIRGWLAYANSVEPSFITSMKKKYPKALRQILKLPFESRSALAEIDF